MRITRLNEVLVVLRFRLALQTPSLGLGFKDRVKLGIDAGPTGGQESGNASL